jgi:hypothetical protein
VGSIVMHGGGGKVLVRCKQKQKQKQKQEEEEEGGRGGDPTRNINIASLRHHGELSSGIGTGLWEGSLSSLVSWWDTQVMAEFQLQASPIFTAVGLDAPPFPTSVSRKKASAGDSSHLPSFQAGSKASKARGEESPTRTGEPPQDIGLTIQIKLKDITLGVRASSSSGGLALTLREAVGAIESGQPRLLQLQDLCIEEREGELGVELHHRKSGSGGGDGGKGKRSLGEQEGLANGLEGEARRLFELSSLHVSFHPSSEGVPVSSDQDGVRSYAPLKLDGEAKGASLTLYRGAWIETIQGFFPDSPPRSKRPPPPVSEECRATQGMESKAEEEDQYPNPPPSALPEVPWRDWHFRLIDTRLALVLKDESLSAPIFVVSMDEVAGGKSVAVDGGITVYKGSIRNPRLLYVYSVQDSPTKRGSSSASVKNKAMASSSPSCSSLPTVFKVREDILWLSGEPTLHGTIIVQQELETSMEVPVGALGERRSPPFPTHDGPLESPSLSRRVGRSVAKASMTCPGTWETLVGCRHIEMAIEAHRIILATLKESHPVNHQRSASSSPSGDEAGGGRLEAGESSTNRGGIIGPWDQIRFSLGVPLTFALCLESEVGTVALRVEDIQIQIEADGRRWKRKFRASHTLIDITKQDVPLVTGSLGEFRLRHNTDTGAGEGSLKWLALTEAVNSEGLLTTCGNFGFSIQEGGIDLNLGAMEPILITILPGLQQGVQAVMESFLQTASYG